MTFEHDGSGRAITETTDTLLVDQTVTNLYDGLNLIGETNPRLAATMSLMRNPVTGAAALQHTTTEGLLDPILGTSEDTSWLLEDRLGSTIAQTGGSRISHTASYDTWGQPTFHTAGWDAATGYTGTPADTSTGLNLFHARTYDPDTANWLTPDPWRGTPTDPGTHNRYA